MKGIGFFFFKQKTAYEIYQCDWSSDVCSSDLGDDGEPGPAREVREHGGHEYAGGTVSFDDRDETLGQWWR